MKDQYAEFFYPDERIAYGTKGTFSVIVALSRNEFMIKTMRDGWLRNTIKERFNSFYEARIYCDVTGLEFKSKNEFLCAQTKFKDITIRTEYYLPSGGKQ